MIVIRNISVIIEFEKVKNENKYQELLTATMSHEMLTPLNSIINLAIYIEQKLFQRFIKEQDIPGMEGSRGGSTSDKVDVKQSLNYLHIIKSSANILQYLVKDLIDLMNIRLDRFVQVAQMFSPTNACNEVL
jgi:signal transduction histidine kinase